MQVRFAREHCFSRGFARFCFGKLGLTRAAQCLGIAAAIYLIASDSLQTAVAEGDTRTLSFHHVHTGEDITVTFKRNGRYDDAALQKLNWFMRDWRKEQQTTMDPHLFDLLWEAYREVGGKEPIQVICGYRSPDTNAMLRARSSGVAQNSLHTHGDAMDFYIPGVPLEAVRNVGLKLQRGGVGFYPTSGSPFVHMDTGSIRHWPRISREQLVKIFPDERTVHVPADGRPLAHYALALADVERAGHAPSRISLASARDSGVIDSNEELAAAEPRLPGNKNLFAAIFGSGDDDKKTDKRPPPKLAPVAVASLTPANRVATERIVPLPKDKPVALAALIPAPANNLVASRGNWPAAVEMGPELAPQGAPVEVADADPTSTAALAYANDTMWPATPAKQAAPMGVALPRMRPASAMAQSAPPRPGQAASQAASQVASQAMSQVATLVGGGLRNDIWMRAAMLAPNTRNYLTTTQIGTPDTQLLRTFMHKPAAALMLSFSADPHDGMVSERFSGHAIVFQATATFGMRTAALR